MREKYLGGICLFYAGIILYVVLTNTLKNYLAPSMQMYLVISIIPLLVMGFVLFFSKSHHKFRGSDLILILPLIFLFMGGDGKLTSSFANNRVMNSYKENSIPIKKNTDDSFREEIEEQEEVSIVEEEEKDLRIDIEEKNEIEEQIENIDFDVVDEAYSTLTNYLTYETQAKKYIGKTVKVRGFVVKNPTFTKKEYFAIGKYEISCCAADAGFTGFIAAYDKSKLKDGNWYEMVGVLTLGKDNYGSEILYLDIKNIKEIDSKTEELYVYPCYSYGDGTCQELIKYNLF